MQKVTSLKSLLQAKGEEFWKTTVSPNLKHILRSTLNGLAHLHDHHHVQHCDMKRKYLCITITHLQYTLYVQCINGSGVLGRLCFLAPIVQISGNCFITELY